MPTVPASGVLNGSATRRKATPRMSVNVLVVLAVAGVVRELCSLVRWWSWLRFCRRMAQQHGVKALALARAVAEAYDVRAKPVRRRPPQRRLRR
jgi:hypothetical protein